ncbi:MAG: hypothetical protein JJE34_03025 [Alphaproteobacteria bacterium]|nr:hypothetical protein [Alphaproteobacteria bacterium]
MVVTLVFIFAAFSKDAFDSKRDADRLLSAIHIEQSILFLKEDIRAEWSATSSAFAKPDGAHLEIVNAATKNEIVDLHSKTNESFAIVEKLSKNSSGSTASELAKGIKALARYNEVSQGIVAALGRPIGANSKKPMADWRTAIVNFASAANNQADMVSREIVSEDLFINELISVNDLAWKTLVAAGAERRYVTAAITAHRPPRRKHLSSSRSRVVG